MRIACVAILVALLALPALAQGTQPAPPPSAPQAVPPAPVPPPPPPRPAWKDKLFFGGGVGAAFGDVDYVELAPLVGYRLHPRVSVGLGLLYRWKNDDRYGFDENLTDYGANVFTRVTLFRSIFAELDYEYLNYEYALFNGGSVRSNSNDFLAGGGFFQPMGAHAGFYASVLYNFSYDDNDPTSPYADPWVYRIGATFGF